MLAFFGFNIIAERNFDTYAGIQAQWNLIHLHNDLFKQSPTYTTRFIYNKSTGFPTLALDLGIQSKKSFRFLHHDHTVACGIKLSASNTNKKIKGLLTFENVNITSDYLVAHHFNVGAVNPYIKVVCKGEHTNFGIAGGMTWYSKLLGQLSAHENIPQEWYTGIHLRPRDHALAGTLKFFVEKEYEFFFSGLSYEYTRGTQQYGRHVFVEQSSAGSRDYLLDLHLLAGANEIEIFQSPTIRFGIHTLSFYCGFSV